MRAHRLREDAPVQHHDLGDSQLGNAARIRERRVEHGYAHVAGGIEVDLVGADRKQPMAMSERMPSSAWRVEPRARADAHHAGALERFPKRFAFERLGEALDIGVAGAGERVDRRVGDTLQEQDFDFLFRTGKDLGHIVSPVRG